MTILKPDFPLAIDLLNQGGRPAESGARMLYVHFWPKFVRYYCMNRQTEGEAEELANEAMLKIVRGVASIKQAASLEAWAWTVARNTLLSAIRQTKEVNTMEITINEDDWNMLVERMPNDANGDPVITLCIESQAQKFTVDHPERALCIEKIVVDGWGLEEIAEFLDRTYEATKEYVSQCRKRLADYLKPCLE